MIRKQWQQGYSMKLYREDDYMKCTGYFITHSTSKGLGKIKERIVNVGIGYYKRHNLYPVYSAVYNDKEGIFVNTDKEIEPMELLAFGFSGLVEDEEKIEEIERFGKYRCIVEYVDDMEIKIIEELLV